VPVSQFINDISRKLPRSNCRLRKRLIEQPADNMNQWSVFSQPKPKDMILKNYFFVIIMMSATAPTK